MMERKINVLSKMIHTSKKDATKKSLLITYIEIENIITSQKESQFLGYIAKTAYLPVEEYNNIQIGDGVATLELGFDDKLRIASIRY